MYGAEGFGLVEGGGQACCKVQRVVSYITVASYNGVVSYHTVVSYNDVVKGNGGMASDHQSGFREV